MADHGHSSQPAVTGMDAHRATYEGFLSGSIALGLICLYVLVALVDLPLHGQSAELGRWLWRHHRGHLATLIGLKAGNKWAIPGVLLVLYALFVAANIHMS